MTSISNNSKKATDQSKNIKKSGSLDTHYPANVRKVSRLLGRSIAEKPAKTEARVGKRGKVSKPLN